MEKASDNGFSNEAILQAIPGILYRADTPPRFITRFISDELKRLLGYDPADFIGSESTWESILHEDDKAPTLERFQAFLDAGENLCTLEYRLRMKNSNTYCWIRDRVSLIRNEAGDPLEIYGVMVDISDLKKSTKELEEARQQAVASEQLKSAFIANMSHEIRTPMNAIVGFSDLLDEVELLPDLKKQYISQIQQNSEQLLCIVNHILDLSKIDAGEVQVVKEPVVLKSFLDDIRQSFEMQALDKDIRIIRFKEGKTIHQPVLIDRSKVRQVLDNLMTNAIKFTEKGYVILGYEVHDEQIKFFVEDTGLGIPLEKAEQIFERFYQEENYLAKNYRGAGLGLSICKRLVNLMGGDIHVRSQINKGSTFWFTIPIRIPSTPPTNTASHQTSETA